MAAIRRPRNIRDIAHLYLSRSHSAAPAPTLNIFLSAETKECFSGFHTANIAAAFSMKRAKVRVFELSGLLPNAAFYFAHRPGVYLRPIGTSSREFSPGLNAISITFGSIRLMGERTSQEDIRVNLVHLPPVDRGEDYAGFLSDLRERCPGERWALHLTRDGQRSAEQIFCDRLGASGAFTLMISKGNGSTLIPAAGGRSLGALSRWEVAVEDRVPIVVRNPNSGLARDYLSLCESLLGQINSLRRHRDAEQRRATWRVPSPG